MLSHYFLVTISHYKPFLLYCCKVRFPSEIPGLQSAPRSFPWRACPAWRGRAGTETQALHGVARSGCRGHQFRGKCPHCMEFFMRKWWTNCGKIWGNDGKRLKIWKFDEVWVCFFQLGKSIEWFLADFSASQLITLEGWSGHLQLEMGRNMDDLLFTSIY